MNSTMLGDLLSCLAAFNIFEWSRLFFKKKVLPLFLKTPAYNPLIKILARVTEIKLI